MDIKIVDSLGKLKLGIGSAIKRRMGILLTDINMPPVVKGLNILHNRCKDTNPKKAGKTI
jgi:hypothetical protein